MLASALALIAVLAVGGLAVRTVVVEQQRDAQVAQAQAIAGLLQRLERPGTEYAILAREDGTAVAAVVASEEGREVFTTGLPANAVDRETYVLWGLRPGADPQPLGTFDVAATAGSTEPVASVSGESGFGQYAISREAGRTAPTAPSAVLAAGQVAA